MRNVIVVSHSILCRIESENKVDQLPSFTTMVVSLNVLGVKNIFEISYQSFEFLRIDYVVTISVLEPISSRIKNQLKVVRCLYILYYIGNEVIIFIETVSSILARRVNWCFRLRIPRVASSLNFLLSFFLLLN